MNRTKRNRTKRNRRIRKKIYKGGLFFTLDNDYEQALANKLQGVLKSIRDSTLKTELQTYKVDYFKKDGPSHIMYNNKLPFPPLVRDTLLNFGTALCLTRYRQLAYDDNFKCKIKRSELDKSHQTEDFSIVISSTETTSAKDLFFDLESEVEFTILENEISDFMQWYCDNNLGISLDTQYRYVDKNMQIIESDEFRKLTTDEQKQFEQKSIPVDIRYIKFSNEDADVSEFVDNVSKVAGDLLGNVTTSFQPFFKTFKIDALNEITTPSQKAEYDKIQTNKLQRASWSYR
jgi:hypothetical protein